MRITQDEAVVMFARYLRARYRKSAVHDARAKATALQKRGDTKGHHIWNKVADEIEKNSKPRPEDASVNQAISVS